MDINEMTIGQVKELKDMFGNAELKQKTPEHDFKVGKKYFVRSVTHHYLGEVVDVFNTCIVMHKCTWIADDGKFSDAMRGEWTKSAEHEPYPENARVSIYLGALCDSVEWNEELISVVKAVPLAYVQDL